MCASMWNKSVKLYAIDVDAIIRTRKVSRYVTRIYVFTEEVYMYLRKNF